MRYDKQDLLSLWEGCHWEQWRVDRPGTVRRGKTRRSDVPACIAESTIKTGWVDTDNGRTGSPTCLRGGLRRNVRLTQDQSCTRRRRRWRCRKWCCQMFLRVNVEEKLWHWLTCEGRTSTQLPLEDCQAGDEHMCGLLQNSLYGTRDAAQIERNWLAPTLSRLKLTRGSACPCVARAASIANTS